MIKRVSVQDLERALVFSRGRLRAVLGPGVHWLWTAGRSVEVEIHSLLQPVLVSANTERLMESESALVEEYFTGLRVTEGRVAVIFVDGSLTRVLGPGERVLLWKARRKVQVREFDATADPMAPAELVIPLMRLGNAGRVQTAGVPEGTAGLVLLNGKFLRLVGPGVYAFWTAAGSVKVEAVDLRRQALEVSGQEILTKDKVTLRVNISAEYRVKDPVAAAATVKNAGETLYRLLQFAVRRALGNRTLDEVLSEKVDIEPAAANAIRGEMAGIGIEVGEMALKDIVLPGEIRVILNQVVAAEKQAQANLIRRREETAATRSLLNTARLMDESPVLMRLKELETLEKLTEKVGSVTVTGGFEGMLEKLLPAGRK